jgi:photosystem II stability/assembly factor-like uncharacterized protein
MNAELLGDGRHGWIADAGGLGLLLATSDGGRSWKRIRIPTRSNDEIDVQRVWFTDPKVGYLTLWHGGGRYEYSLARTSDAGASWNTIQRWTRVR